MIDLAPFVRTLHTKPLAVFGLGRSGRATVRAVTAAGGCVHAWDDSAAARETIETFALYDIINAHMEDYAALILAPGVPLDHPVVQAAQVVGCPIFGDMEILHRANHGRYSVGITGTNGKSTTTALTAHIARACGADIACGGNIGVPVLDLNMPGPKGAFVLEISSFQGDLCPTFRPDSAALLNLEPDHMARHGTMEAYVAAKERLFEGKGLAVIGIDDPQSRALLERVAKRGERRIIPISMTSTPVGGLYVKDGALIDHTGHAPIKIADLSSIASLRGAHNGQNAAAAAALCLYGLSLPVERLQKALQSWGGLPHRQFLIRTIRGVDYINDSKGTNPPATATALAAFAPIYWICGGNAREVDLGPLLPYLPRVRHAFVIGSCAPDFCAFLASQNVAYTLCGTIDKAVSAAHIAAHIERVQGSVVLLSPAYQSFDQFRDFEDRGDQFAALVRSLPESL